ncbi:17403_t:CDS:2 [Funneliformis geosporum]|nr:17403_t:CDS:2 [Funneliformis geosporum]
MAFDHVKNKNTWCPECNRHSIETAKSLARIKNGDGLSLDYVNNKTPLQQNRTISDMKILAQRNNGDSPPKTILRGGWCSLCLFFKRENLCREIISKYLGPPSKNRKPDFLKTLEHPRGLELDIPYYHYDFAIEVQGEQHEKYHEFFHRGDLNNFIKQQAQDQLKKELCEKNQMH